MYSEEVKSQNSQVEAFLIEQRKIEERGRSINAGVQVDSIEDYIQEQLRFHSADKKIVDAKALIDKCDSIKESSLRNIKRMQKANPSWKKNALSHYKKIMVELGEPEPKSFYDV
jgi:hypothetical protein